MTWMHRAARRSSGILLAIGATSLAYAGYLVLDARAYQRKEQARFEQTREHAKVTAALAVAKEEPVPAARVPDDGDAIGKIVIERLELAVMIAQGDSAEILQRAVGHLSATALPGANGNVVLAGHRDTFFRPLKDLRIGDRITVKTERSDFDYVVESLAVVKPTDVYVLQPTGGQTLTLITCYPFYYVGAAPNRFIVRARARLPLQKS